MNFKLNIKEFLQIFFKGSFLIPTVHIKTNLALKKNIYVTLHI